MVVVTVFWSFPAWLGRAAPAAGVQAQRPQRSEDERPGGWRGWRNTGPSRERTGAVSVVCSCRVPSSWLTKISSGGPGVRLPVIPSPLGARHEAVRLQQGGINQGDDHAIPIGVGVMTPAITRPAGPILLTRPLWPTHGFRRRAGRSRRR